MHAFAVPSGDDLRSRNFSSLLLASFLIPPLIFALLFQFAHLPSSLDAYTVIFLASVAHGGLSGLFWIDRRYRQHLSDNKSRNYGIFAALLILAVAGPLVFGRPFVVAFTVLYLGWTAVHFARQNWGMLCLAGSGLKGARPYEVESHGCTIAGYGAAICLVAPALGNATGVRPDAISAFGLLLCLVALGLAIIAAWRHYRAGAPRIQVVLSLCVGLYFAPIFLLEPMIGFTCVGTVHALQYAMVMWGIAADKGQGSPVARTAGTLACALAYLGAFVLLRDSNTWGEWSDPALMALYSVVMWHFVLDAGMFRLRSPEPRRILSESLPHLFPARAKAPIAA